MLKLLTITFIMIISQTTISAQNPQNIFLLGGQSNMAGRGGVNHNRWDKFIPPECKPRPEILRLSAENKWVPAQEPLHYDIDVGKTCGVGPGMAFANGVISLGGLNKFGSIGLVPCGIGGSKISEWGKGKDLYSRLVERGKFSMEGGGNIRGLLWYQGESDTVRFQDADNYGGKMEKMIRDLRFDLGLPSLLVIQVGLASGEGQYVEKVRKAQLGLKLPNVKCVDAKRLRVGIDHLHLTTGSQVRLGLMLARSFLNMTHKFQSYEYEYLGVVSNSSSLVV